MSYNTVHKETYTHKCGKQYIVEVEVDHDFGAPEDNGDCHGPVVELDFDPGNPDDVDYYIEINTEEDSPEELEERARMGMMRELGQYGYRNSRFQRKYYDVWGALKKAKKDWGCTTDAEAQLAVDRDYAYINGWYNEDWYWCAVFVYATDEDGEKAADYHCIGGYESTIIEPENRAHLVEVIEDCIHQVEYDIRQARHPGQRELALAFA